MEIERNGKIYTQEKIDTENEAWARFLCKQFKKQKSNKLKNNIKSS